MGIAIVDKKTNRKVGGSSNNKKVGEKMSGSGRNLSPRDAKPFRDKLIQTTAKKIAKTVDPDGRLSTQDISRAFSIARGMIAPQAKKAGGKVSAKKMATGGKAKKKSKGMARGGKTMMKSKGMKRGGKMSMKSKGMARGGKMKSKGMARGGKAKR